MFNGWKCVVTQLSKTFFGCVYDKDGAHPDPAKVNAVQNIPLQKHQHSSKSFLAWSHTYHPLHLYFPPSLHPSVNYSRRKQSSHEINDTRKAFENVKFLVCQETTLRFFPMSVSLSQFRDASWKDLGATYSRIATQMPLPQSPNICRIVLYQHRAWHACLHLWCRMVPHICFWPCIYYWEWPQAPQSDQVKEPGTCSRPSLENAAPLQNYEVTIKYHPGKDMLVADAFSHYVSPDAPEDCHKLCTYHPTEDRVQGSYLWWPTSVHHCRHNPCWLASRHK